MAEAGQTTSKPVNPLPAQGDHDRVQMLSLRADGTPDQHNPEVIGDQDAAVRAAQEQFKQQAVSANDVQRRGSVPVTGGIDPDGTQDASIAKAQAEDEKIAKAAEAAAEKTVKALHDEA